MQYVIKLVITAALIVAVSEASKTSTRLGALLASLPLVSYLGIIWTYAETRDNQRIAALSQDIFWLVVPSLAFFATLPWLLKKMHVAPAMAIATLIMFAAYALFLWVLPNAQTSN